MSCGMKTILCFGDSNTWGYDPQASANSPFPQRYAADVRWTGVMAQALGADWTIIAEGQNGRTAVHEDNTAPASRCGKAYLPSCLESHQPIDAVVIMLGTNELKTMFNLPAQDLAAGVGILVQIVLKSTAGPNAQAPKVLIVCPAPVADLTHLPDLQVRFEHAREKSLEFPRHYAAIAEKFGVGFLNIQDQLEPSPLDGLHLDPAAHQALGSAVTESLRRLLD